MARGRDEPGELAGVAVELPEQHARGGNRRVEVLPRELRLARPARVLGGGALKDVLNALAGGRVERVEQLVQIDRARRRGPRQDSAGLDRRGSAGPRVEVDVAIG